jgi:hypothetical protein
VRARVLLLALASCGYSPVHGVGRGEALSVALVESKVPDAVATDEVLAGARDELARAGSLAPGRGYPRLEIEVLRVDESSDGVAATAGADGRRLPLGRATRVGLVARGWVVRAPGGQRERDTGDVRVVETAAAALDARSDVFLHADTLRVAGRRVGKQLTARILGFPSASVDD